MAEISFRYVTEDTDPALDQLKPLLAELYRGMREQGLMIPLADTGADKWTQGIQSTLGKFGALAVAYEDNKLIAFAHGALKFLPDYLGNLRTGVITHIFVKPEYREQQLGLKLVHMLEKWFSEKKVYSIELQVVSGNAGAMDFWEKAGYTLELHQFRKFHGKTF